MGVISTPTTFSTSSIMASYGIPDSVWQPIQTVESGGNPDAYVNNANEESVGLFQLNRKNGLGVGYSVDQLKDPVVNATIAAQKMSPNVKAGQAQGLTGYALTQYVAANSGFPTEMGVSAMPSSYATKLLAAFGGSDNSTGSSGSKSSSSSSSSLNLLSIGTDKLKSAFWLVVGVVVVFFGVQLLTNPMSGLTDAISSLKIGGIKGVE